MAERPLFRVLALRYQRVTRWLGKLQHWDPATAAEESAEGGVTAEERAAAQDAVRKVLGRLDGEQQGADLP